MKQFVLLASLVALPCLAEQCPDLARAVKESEINMSSSGYLNSIFDNYCEKNGTKKDSQKGFGLEAVVKAIPFRLTGTDNDIEQKMHNFCRNYSSSESLQTRDDRYSEKLTDNAIDTVRRCVELQAENIIIKHKVVNRDQMTFYLRSSLEKKISLTGVNITGSATCSANIEGRQQMFDKKINTTNTEIQKALGLTCVRTPRTMPSGVQIYEEAVITVVSNFEPYSVLWRRDERLTEDMASELARAVDASTARANTVERALIQRLTEFVSNGTISPGELQSKNALCVTGGETACTDAATRWCQDKKFKSGILTEWNATERKISCIGNAQQ